MQLEDSAHQENYFQLFFDCTQTMIHVLIIFLMCNIFKGKKVKIKMMQCLASPIQPKGIRFDPFLFFIFFSQTRQMMEKM
jgi:hypothetical protein